MSNTSWVKSSYSTGEGGNCIEWSPATLASAGVVPVRDSKDPEGPALLFRPDAFAAFVDAVKAGQFPVN